VRSNMPHKMEAERLQKALARLGLASRREAEEWIRAGRLTINGQVASLGARVTDADQIRLDGRLIRRRATGAHQAFVCHRSPGESLRAPQHGAAESASAAESEHADEPDSARTPFVDRLPKGAGRRFITVSPMPRVDGGLELVTADGELAEKLQRSVKRLTSEFSVRVRGELEQKQLDGILSGVLDRGVAIEVESCEASGGEGANRWYTIGARGGSGKDIRQLFERQGAIVSRVLRTRLGPVSLDRTLSRGHFRQLSPAEIDSLLAAGSTNPQDESPAQRGQRESQDHRRELPSQRIRGESTGHRRKPVAQRRQRESSGQGREPSPQRGQRAPSGHRTSRTKSKSRRRD
jgi:23S rRNA pseudouridine2605 synthase